MNRLLLFDDDFRSDGSAEIRGRRLQHLQSVLAASRGDDLRLAHYGGMLGTGRLLNIDAESARIQPQLSTPPPAKLPLTLVLALPRPKALRRIVRAITELGVEKLILIHSAKVEKSYWQSPLITAESIDQFIIEAMEQSGDSIPLQWRTARLFRPFAEDELPSLTATCNAMVAHPRCDQGCPRQSSEPALLTIGPEGGFTDFELNLLASAGCRPVHIGPRIQRVETAVTALTTQLFNLAASG